MTPIMLRDYIIQIYPNLVLSIEWIGDFRTIKFNNDVLAYFNETGEIYVLGNTFSRAELENEEAFKKQVGSGLLYIADKRSRLLEQIERLKSARPISPFI